MSLNVSTRSTVKSVFANYLPQADMFDEAFILPGEVRPIYQRIHKLFQHLKQHDYFELNHQARQSFFDQGITFAVYGNGLEGSEKIFPFDLFPRIIPNNEWQQIEKGLIQRTMAINEFIWDVYHDGKIFKDRIVPRELVRSSRHFLKQMKGLDIAGNIYTHISGTDVIRHSDGQYYVLEDNVRCPSGVSYVLKNRQAMKQSLFGIFDHCRACSVNEYPLELKRMLHSVSPKGVDNPSCVLLTPGMYNSAYYEHTFLANSMGLELVEGRDLFVENDFVYMKTMYGPVKVDVIYRRIDDDFLDPEVFREDSLLGVKGLMRAYKAGNVSLVNAPGTGIADDKAVYSYIPAIIKYYLGEEPILHNITTYRCDKNKELTYVLEHMDKLVIKPVDESGGYGVAIGNTLSKKEKEALKDRIISNRRKYIAQPIMDLSTHPTFIEEKGRFEARHIDLRTFTLLGKEEPFVLKGGLSRVALREGSLIVNSSQGGGSKDTWVMQA